MTFYDLSFQQSGLIQQGYCTCTKEELRSINNGLRFTPTVCMMLAIVGLYLQIPYLNFTLAALGILPFWLPKAHPFDLFYNGVIIKFTGGSKLPANPLPRRIACVIGGSFNAGIGFAFLYNLPMLAYLLGGILIPLQIIVITTHFCLASWMWEKGMKLFGVWKEPVSLAEAESLLKSGAILVDVRSEVEYHQKTLPNAVNIPLENIENQVENLKNKPVLLFCASGMRSLSAYKKLKNKGINEVYDFGSMNRWKF